LPAGEEWSAAELAALSRHVLRGRRVVRQRRLTGGYRNDNVQVITDEGESFVLRRYREPSACAVELGLAARLTGGVVPVPEVVYADVAGELSGRPVLVSRFEPGTPGDRVLTAGTSGDSAALGRAMGAVLAAIGDLRFSRPGFFNGPDLALSGEPPASYLAEFVARELPAGHAATAFTGAELAGLQDLAARCAPLVELVSAEARLVHGDYNPKNVLAERAGDGWRITAVLDWEFALSATPMFDVGNALRFADERPWGFADGFVAGYTGAGGQLPDRWPAISRAVDLFSLVQFLAHPPEHRYFQKSVRLLRARLAEAPG
jgi:aminoglycoside phosphotransferase (APT) family kinase protein